MRVSAAVMVVAGVLLGVSSASAECDPSSVQQKALEDALKEVVRLSAQVATTEKALDHVVNQNMRLEHQMKVLIKYAPHLPKPE
jgi:hypothetical protein